MMGDRGFNAGGYAYMRRVWCPCCGISYPVGHRRFEQATDKDGEKPKLYCRDKPSCVARATKKGKL